GTAAYGDTWNLGAEAKMDIAGGNVGLALAKMGDADSQWSVFGSYPVVKDTMTVYGEYGKTAAEADVKNIGIKGTISGLNYILEDDLASEMGYAEIGKPVNGVTYKAMYYFGDGLSATNDGKVQLEARVDF
ncbi:MAG: hypothetical protein ACM3UP_02645, partial [Methanocella sp.]